MSVRSVPEGLGDAGAALWRAMLKAYEFGPAELEMLRHAAAADRLTVLEPRAAKDPLGPAGVECRQTAIVQARLLTALRLPTDDEPDEKHPQRRGMRGTYGQAGAG